MFQTFQVLGAATEEKKIKNSKKKKLEAHRTDYSLVRS